MTFTSSSGTGTSAGFGFHAQPQPVTGAVDVTLTPPIRGHDVLRLAQQGALALWPDRRDAGLRALAPLLGSIAREANARCQGCKVRVVRRGDRQHIEPILPPPPPDGEWPAEDAVVIATERNLIVEP